jgi:metal-sulfur cluster biosynthetic enzyme
MALTEEDIFTALRDCYDPEIPVNIVDLGLIYKIMLTPDANSKRTFPRQRVEVEMTMTSQGCPAHVTIMEQVRNRLAGIPERSAMPWSTWYGNRHGPRTASARRPANTWESVRSYGRTTFSTTARSLSP